MMTVSGSRKDSHAGRRSIVASMGSMIILMSYICLPFASPFVVGTYVSTPSISHTATGIRASAGLTLESENNNQIDEDTRRDLSDKNINRWKGGEYNSTLLSRLFFTYASPLVDAAGTRELVDADAFKIPLKKRMGSKVQELATIYKQCINKAHRKEIEIKKQKGNDKTVVSESTTLLRALLLHQRGALVTTGILRLANTAIQALPALLVSRLLRSLEEGNQYPPGKALSAAVSLVAVLSIKMLTENQYFNRVVNGGTQVRGTLSGLIFDKSLRLPSGSEGGRVSKNGKKNVGRSNGSTLNLMDQDTSTLEFASLQIHTIWDGPLQIAMYMSLLYRYLGPSVFWGIGILIAVIPINSITLQLLNKMRKLENEAKDARVEKTTEAISNMKLLKLQGWESYFADAICGYRADELSRHFSSGVVRALNNAISNAVPALVLVVTLSAYAKSGRPIVASTIFTAISLFNQLRLPLFFLPVLISSLANGKNALRRISSYLSAEEMTKYVQTLPPIMGGGRIEMKNGNFLWSSSTADADGKMQQIASPALCQANVNIEAGEVVAVVGSVGSGKTALIKGLLGELSPVPRALINTSSKSATQNEYAFGNLEKPSVVAHGNTSYCSQESWLPKGTLRDAVVFGRDYEETRYLAALKDSGLNDDIVDDMNGSNWKAAASRGVLSHDTDVGEGGSSLSGGQRARVALARALYAADDTKVFLLDDPLAALDAAVGATVFERMTKRLRESGAATLLVTNDPNIPRRCDRVILMGKYNTTPPSCSTVVDIGTYDELIARGHDLSSLSSSKGSPEEKERHAEKNSEEAGNTVSDTPPTQRMQSVSNFTSEGHTEMPAEFNTSTVNTQHADLDCSERMQGLDKYVADKSTPANPDAVNVEEEIFQKQERQVDTPTSDDSKSEAGSVQLKLSTRESKKLVSADDTMAKGAVPLSAYSMYLKSVRKPLLIAAMLASYFMSSGSQFYQQFVVSKWTELGRDNAMAASLGAKYLNSLVKAAGVVSIFLWLRSFLTMKAGIKASSFLHKKMLNSVFRAPMSFFDATPSGQLLSRFGKEIETVDYGVPDSIGSSLYCFIQIALSVGALAGVITPAMLIPLSFVSIFYSKTMSRFRPAARDLKRSESRTRSPIYTHFGEALRGKEIIRSVPHASLNWLQRHHSLTDKNLSIYYTVKSLDRWLSLRLETLGNVVVFTAAVVSVFLTRAGRLKPGSAGWGLTQALAITGLLTWAVRCLTDLETNMMSVMRVKEMTDLDSELDLGRKSDKDAETRSIPTISKEKQNAGEALVSLYSGKLHSLTSPMTDSALVQSGWPWKGDIEFDNVSMRYNEVSPLVLKNVSIKVPPGTTLGVVGRTGSGKSSLLVTLFRLVEVEAGGNIRIDNVDIRSVSLQTLRESLSIIPQDPVLFAGTLMYNLDATGKASEKNAWKALNAASPELAKQFNDVGTGLSTYISEGGKNLSSGQRQLICLARALLRKSKILVMDEATSSVDSQTDAQVQETIRKEFVNNGVTVITVAHRLDTILGYDKIAVFGTGELIEYGPPNELLQMDGGELRRLVMQDRENKEKGASKEKEEVYDGLVSA